MKIHAVEKIEVFNNDDDHLLGKVIKEGPTKFRILMPNTGPSIHGYEAPTQRQAIQDIKDSYCQCGCNTYIVESIGAYRNDVVKSVLGPTIIGH